jgi:hypothetical protein
LDAGEVVAGELTISLPLFVVGGPSLEHQGKLMAMEQ